MDQVELAYAGIAEQARLLQAGEVSSRELVEVYLDRIARIDPTLRAFQSVFAEQARAEASAADDRLAAGDTSPLLGVPVAFKDELDLAGHVTRHGTLGYDEPAATDAEHPRRIRAAGAVVLGKTNLPELAICGFTETDANGITRNPWDLDRTPGGSSGGSGAAVAAGLVGAASASDGAGSIRIPAANCGLFGLKPQRGRVSLRPESEHWYGMSKTGCLTRRVLDTALWLDVAAGAAPGEAHTPPPPARPYVDAARSEPDRLRVAWSVETAPMPLRPPVSDEVVATVLQMAELLEKLGHHVTERSPDYGSVASGIGPLYLRGILQHWQEVPHPERLERRTRGFARLGRTVPSHVLRSALRARDEHTRRINTIFDDVDVLLTPVTAQLPVPVGEWAGKGAARTAIGMSRVYPFTAVWNYTGQPAASVPVGVGDDGLPRSVMLIAPANREDLLLSLGAQLERVIDWPAALPPLGRPSRSDSSKTPVADP